MRIQSKGFFLLKRINVETHMCRFVTLDVGRRKGLLVRTLLKGFFARGSGIRMTILVA
jgi:hypothetical protein